jgi:hypothetical protein
VEREGGDTPQKAKATGRRERRSAGPDGPDAKAVGETFRRPSARRRENTPERPNAAGA